MVDDDIYGNEKTYQKLKRNLAKYLNPPSGKGRRKYWIKNRKNLKYFDRMFDLFEARDTSYIRRLRLLRSFLIVCHVLEIELANAGRRHIEKVMAFGYSVNRTVISKERFVRDLKFIWKQLFPEKDEKGRDDETIVPYVVRHLSGRVDKSREKMRQDKLTLEEFERLVQSFAGDPRMQCLVTMAFEGLGRPQELLGRRIRDVELHDNYAKIYITEHGKEGVGFIGIIDSYFYLVKWLNVHPLRDNHDEHLFVNLGRVNRFKQLKPSAANKLLRYRCKTLGINKPITLYSLKRNGVTMRRLSGQSDVEIQHAARWTSTRQLHTYDLSNQEDGFKITLIKRGIIKPSDGYKSHALKSKTCTFCEFENGIAELICNNCKRLLDREQIKKQIEERDDELSKLKTQMQRVQNRLAFLEKYEDIIERGLV